MENTMNPEQRKNSMFIGNERRTFARIPVATLELDLLQEQEFKTTCQEISDLYHMLQVKCCQGDQFHAAANFPVTTEQTHAEEQHRKLLV
jgi:hypothetical protein